MRSAEQRHQQRVEDIPVLRFLDGDGHHANFDGKGSNSAQSRFSRAGMGHDFGDIHRPDQVGEVQGAVLGWPPGVFGKLAGQECGGVGRHQAVGLQQRRQAAIHLGLDLRDLRHSFYHQVRQRHRLSQIGAVAQALARLVQFLFAGAQVCAIYFGILLMSHSATPKRLIKQVIHHHILAHVRTVPGNLPAQNARTEHRQLI